MNNTLFQVARNSMMKNRVRYKSMMSKLPTINPIPDPFEIEDKPLKASTSSKAMKAYLDRVEKYNKFMSEERLAFDIGKRHLANMMGRDYETFTQADIDESVEYLFPCSLTEPRSRPLMKPPEEIYPPKKEAEFDSTGRPHHFLFYTTKPNFYQILHDAVKIFEELNAYEDKIIHGNETNRNYTSLNLSATTWIEKTVLEKICCEPLTNNEFEQLKLILERIANHPYGNKYAAFVFKFCIQMTEKHELYETRKPEILEDNRQRFYFPDIRRKEVAVDVAVTYPGTGQFIIDDQDIRFFPNVQHREAVLFPLVLSNMVKKVDVEAKVLRINEGGGHTALATCIRLGVSRGLFHFVDDFTKDKMKLAGLLNPDIREKERKKPGQEGARRKFTWKKR